MCFIKNDTWQTLLARQGVLDIRPALCTLSYFVFASSAALSPAGTMSLQDAARTLTVSRILCLFKTERFYA
jgi:hypothetical protein